MSSPCHIELVLTEKGSDVKNEEVSQHPIRDIISKGYVCLAAALDMFVLQQLLMITCIAIVCQQSS